MITARQSRAARALLGWTQETLADRARVSLTALKRLESDSGLEVYESTRDQVRRAFEGSGIVLLNSGQSVGAMLVGDKRSEEHTSELQSLIRISYAVFCLKKKT